MVIMAKDGGCRGRGRIGDSKPGYHNLMLMLVVAGVLRNAVADDCYLNGYEAVSPRRRGDQADVRAPSRTSQKLLAKGAPGLSRGGAPKSKRGGDKVPCCNPSCPGVAGRQSFKYDYAIGKGQSRWNCVACDMPWERSWHVHYNGHAPPARGSKYGWRRWADYEEDDDEWDVEVPDEGSPAYDALPATYKAILADIIAAPDEESRQRGIDHFKDDDSPTGKAMLAAYAETMATKQAVDRPVLRHPVGEPAGVLDALKKEKNQAEQLHRQVSAALQKKNLHVLAIQERMAQDQKEGAARAG